MFRKKLTKEQLAHFKAAGKASSDWHFIVQTILRRSGLNQKELADRLGLAESTLSYHLTSGHKVKLETMARILSAMGDKLRISSEEFEKAILEKEINPLYPKTHSFPQTLICVINSSERGTRIQDVISATVSPPSATIHQIRERLSC